VTDEFGCCFRERSVVRALAAAHEDQAVRHGF
jgi:hypothetical protein